MQIDESRRYGLARAAMVVILTGLVAGCVGPSEPAPVYLRGASDPVIAPMPAPPPAMQVIVKRGQTLDGYAYTYHLPKSAIVAANRLRPPYKLEAGQRLVIPNPRGSVRQAMIPPPAPAARPWSPSPVPPQQQAAVPQPPRSPEAPAMPAPASNPPQTIFATPAQPLPPAQPTPTQVSPPPAAPPPAAAKSQPDIIPLDGPPPVKEAEATLTPPQQQPTPSPTVVPLTGAPPPASAAPGAQTDAAPPGGRFPWPVRGRVLGAYGNSPGGGHNDGINIAAPLGTPVRAIDGGTVVYSGNEVKGYGNIVLIRHANGWISAYAHLEDVDVKQGDAISPGEVIAKVGNSGGVTEPQLHFELRRGKKPVNPTEFLAPAPSAEGAGNGAG